MPPAAPPARQGSGDAMASVGRTKRAGAAPIHRAARGRKLPGQKRAQGEEKGIADHQWVMNGGRQWSSLAWWSLCTAAQALQSMQHLPNDELHAPQRRSSAAELAPPSLSPSRRSRRITENCAAKHPWRASQCQLVISAAQTTAVPPADRA